MRKTNHLLKTLFSLTCTICLTVTLAFFQSIQTSEAACKVIGKGSITIKSGAPVTFGSAKTTCTEASRIGSSRASSYDTPKDGMMPDDMTQDDMMHDDMAQDDMMHDDMAQDDMMPDDMAQDDMVPNDMAQDDMMHDDMAQDDMMHDDMAQDDMMHDDMTQDDMMPDDMAQDDMMHDDMTREVVVVRLRDEDRVIASADNSQFTILYDTASSDLPPAEYLDPMIDSYDALSLDAGIPFDQITIIIKGYADTVGGEYFNDILATERAEHVRQLLTEYAIPTDTIRVFSYGEEGLAVPTADEVSEVRNRRVEVILCTTEVSDTGECL